MFSSLFYIPIMPAVVEDLRHIQITPEQLVAGTGLNSKQLCNPQTRYNVQQMHSLARTVVDVSGQADYWLLFRHRFPNAPSHYLIKRACLSSDFREYSQVIGRAFLMMGNGNSVTVNIKPKRVELRYRNLFVSPVYRYLPDVWLSALHQNIRNLFAGDMRPSSVSLVFPKPSYWKSYEELFQCPIEFGAPKNTIIYPVELVEAKSSYADPHLAAIIDAYSLSIESPLRSYLQMMSIQEWLLDHSDHSMNSSHELAAELGLSPRGLRALLKRNGTSFRDLKNNVNFWLTGLHQANGASIEKISELLGYSEASAFRRAKRKNQLPKVEFVF